MGTVGAHNEKPLKILTIDGGGLHALATLSILNDLCDRIAVNNGAKRKPAPFELFDIICGIGTGGWIALLLGRYRLDIAKCMSVYMQIADAIDFDMARKPPVKRTGEFRFDQKTLISTIDDILERNHLSPNLLDSQDSEFDSKLAANGIRIRCKYTFAAAAVAHPAGTEDKYEIFRTYETEKTDSKNYHPGPNPALCKASAACAATGAAKYILSPYTVGTKTFSDERFPEPHNITFLALDEAYHLFGASPELSVVVNIGPGTPSQGEINKLRDLSIKRMTRLSRQFSWPYKMRPSWRRSSSRILSSKGNSDSQEEASQPNRSDTTTSSDSDSSIVSAQEKEIEDKIRQRLDEDYNTNGHRKYHRLGSSVPRESVSLNDVSAVGCARQEAEKLLVDKSEQVHEAALQYGSIILAC